MGTLASESANINAWEFIVRIKWKKRINENILYPLWFNFNATGTTTCSQIRSANACYNGFHTGSWTYRPYRKTLSALALSSIIFQSESKYAAWWSIVCNLWYWFSTLCTKNNWEDIKTITIISAYAEQKKEFAWKGNGNMRRIKRWGFRFIIE